MKYLFVVLALVISSVTYAKPGSTLYVKGKVVNMRAKPSTSSAIVTKLHQGHKLIEIQKQGNWFEVGADGTGGKTGWIYSNLVSSTPVATSKNDSTYPPFKKFVNEYYNRLNKGLFTRSEYKGDGIIDVHVNNAWLSVPRDDKTWSMNILLEAWSKCESGVVSINMISPSGRFVMSNTKR